MYLTPKALNRSATADKAFNLILVQPSLRKQPALSLVGSVQHLSAPNRQGEKVTTIHLMAFQPMPLLFHPSCNCRCVAHALQSVVGIPRGRGCSGKEEAYALNAFNSLSNDVMKDEPSCQLPVAVLPCRQNIARSANPPIYAERASLIAASIPCVRRAAKSTTALPSHAPTTRAAF